MLKRFLQCSAAKRQLLASQNQQQSNDLTRSAGEQQSSPFIPPDKPEPLHCLCHSLKAQTESQQVWAALQCSLPTFSLPFPCRFLQGTTLCTSREEKHLLTSCLAGSGVTTTLGPCTYLEPLLSLPLTTEPFSTFISHCRSTLFSLACA